MSRDEAVAKIAESLGETDAIPLKQIGEVLDAIGEERTLELLAETLAIEERGGELVPDGSRRRSPGGVFFQLVRKVLPRDIKQRIFYSHANGAARTKKAAPQEVEPAAPQKSRRPRIIEVARELTPKPRRKSPSYPPKASGPGFAGERPGGDKDKARERIRFTLSSLSAMDQRELLLELIAEIRPDV